jgi:hypothetical protein
MWLGVSLMRPDSVAAYLSNPETSFFDARTLTKPALVSGTRRLVMVASKAIDVETIECFGSN